jgi:hypothetical protein
VDTENQVGPSTTSIDLIVSDSKGDSPRFVVSAKNPLQRKQAH